MVRYMRGIFYLLLFVILIYFYDLADHYLLVTFAVISMIVFEFLLKRNA